MESLFGVGLPTFAKFLIALVIVLGIIAGAAALWRRFGANAFASGSLRGRQPRLAVIDTAPVDSRRRLVLIRRDNVEHLMLVGGPTDVVVEPNIVRTNAAIRETPPPRLTPETFAPAPAETGWPLSPEPAAPRAARPAAAQQPREEWPPLQPAEPQMRRPEPDRISGLAADLSRVAGQPELGPPHQPPAPPVQPQRHFNGDAGRAPNYAEPPRFDAPRMDTPRMDAPRDGWIEPPRMDQPRADQPRMEPPRTDAPRLSDTSAEEKLLGDMATRLEAALRRPQPNGNGIGNGGHHNGHNGGGEAPSIDPAPRGPTEPLLRSPAPTAADLMAPLRPGKKAAAPPPPEPKRDKGKAISDSLEEEMANLLGRPSRKT